MKKFLQFIGLIAVIGFVGFLILGYLVTKGMERLSQESPNYSDSSTTVVSSAPIANVYVKGVEVVEARVADEYGFANLVLTVKNVSGKKIKGLKVAASFKNNFNEQVLEDISRKKRFGGISQETLGIGAKADYKRQLSLFNNATKVDQLYITSVVYEDGTTENARIDLK